MTPIIFLKKIIDDMLPKLDKVIISISGAGCIGKSTLAEKLANTFGDHQCQVIGLDGYMLERKKRQELGNLTGYNPNGFELFQAQQQLQSLINNNNAFTLYQYNRQTHLRDIEQLILPKKIIILEGGMALREEFSPLANIKIFLEANEKIQYCLRVRREQQEFGYTENMVSSRFTKYFTDYQQYILPQKRKANLIFSVDELHNLRLIYENW
jgi:phosphoribulokinase